MSAELKPAMNTALKLVDIVKMRGRIQPRFQPVYLAGPMSGYVGRNFPAFTTAARTLREAGVEVVSPHEFDEDEDNPDERVHTWEFYLRRDLSRLLACQSVVTLPYWFQSRGAVLETFVADMLGMPVYFYSPNLSMYFHPLNWEEYLPILWKEADGVSPTETPVDDRTVLEEAKDLIYGDRQQAYTHPLDNFFTIGRIWGAILGGGDLPPVKVGLMMAGLKLAREAVNHKRDNLTDAAGYIGTVEMVINEIKRRTDG